MNRTPEQQWSALSALYEEADMLPASALATWLAELEAQGNPLLPQLKRMLEARAHLETDDFLGTLPKLSADADEQASAWAEGSRVGPYRLVRPLGEGGMAEVWLAERADGAFKRQVAIKLPYPRPGRESFALRFDRERDILATLRHPHIAGLYDAGVTKDGQAWLALEYVEGQPISTYCDERRLSVRERVQLFRQVLLAVQHAHANLVIHRDLKPANILVTPQGEVRLLDFGIAKLLEAQGDAIAETELTRQAGRSMTPRYASPEQLTGLPLTTACDVYSLGVVFYELMCGERPYELKVESAAQLEHAILEAEPRAMSRRALAASNAEARATSVKALRRALSPELDAIALRCLAKMSSARYASVDAVLADLDRWLAGEAVLARTPSSWYRWTKFAVRHRWGVGLGTSAVLALAATAAVAIVLGMDAREESARAVAARDFMLGLFQRADQEKSRGADVSARELLEAGRRDVLTRLDGQLGLQAELLAGIGAIQMDMGEYGNAESTFSDAIRILSRIGLPREETRARAAHADSVLRMGDAGRAAALLEEAKAVVGRPKGDHELNAYLTEVEGWIANVTARPELARELFSESRQHAIAAFGATDQRAIRALRGSIHAERQLGRFDAALALQDELESATMLIAPHDLRQSATSDAERAEILLSAGRYDSALKHMEKSLPKCVEQLGPNDEACRRLLISKVAASFKLGFIEDAENHLPQLVAMSEERSSPTLQAEALLLALRIETIRGTSPQQITLADRVRAFGQSGPEVAGPGLKAKALLTLGEAYLVLGQPDEARRWLEMALTSAKEGSRPPLLVGVGNALMGVSFLVQHDAAQALSWLQKGQTDIVAGLGSKHPLAQMFALNVAVALDSIGQGSQALALVKESQEVLELALGASSPMFLRVLRLRERIEYAPSLPTTDRSHMSRSPRGTTAPATPEFFS